MEEKDPKKQAINVMPQNPNELKKMSSSESVPENQGAGLGMGLKTKENFDNPIQNNPKIKTNNNTDPTKNVFNADEESVKKARRQILNNTQKISDSLKKDGINIIDEDILDEKPSLEIEINQELKKSAFNVMPQINQNNNNNPIERKIPEKKQIPTQNKPETKNIIENINTISAGPSELGDIRAQKITPGNPEEFRAEEEKRGIVQDNNERVKKAEELIKKAKGTEHMIRPLRTYEDDVSSFVREKKVSTAKIMMAEQQRRQARETQAAEMPIEDQIREGIKEKSNLIKIIISIVLIILGAGILVGAFFFFNIGETINNFVPGPEKESEIIEKEVEIVINANNKFTDQIRDEITKNIEEATGLGNRQIVEIQIVRDGSFGEGASASRGAQINTTQFFQILDSIAPESLIRGLGSTYFLGVIQLEKVHPFILFKINDFDPVFAGMFAWENFMIRDIDEIFPETLIQKEVIIEEQVATSTESGTETLSTSTEPKEPQKKLLPEFDPRDFKDATFINRDARVITDIDGKLLFYYSFIDEENLILADNPEVMRELIQRLNTQKLVR